VFFLLLLVVFVVGTGDEIQALCMLAKCSTTELYPQPLPVGLI
jgi:hypothetical protein